MSLKIRPSIIICVHTSLSVFSYNVVSSPCCSFRRNNLIMPIEQIYINILFCPNVIMAMFFYHGYGLSSRKCRFRFFNYMHFNKKLYLPFVHQRHTVLPLRSITPHCHWTFTRRVTYRLLKSMFLPPTPRPRVFNIFSEHFQSLAFFGHHLPNMWKVYNMIQNVRVCATHTKSHYQPAAGM